MKKVIAGALLLASCATAPVKPPMLDLKITNGRILDGTGTPWFRGDIGVRGDTIVAMGRLDAMTAASTIDARDRIVAPGFIDLLGWSHFSVLEDSSVEAKVRQGVTTEVTGEGFSPGPVRPERRSDDRQWNTLGEFLDHLDEKGTATTSDAIDLGTRRPASSPWACETTSVLGITAGMRRTTR